METLLTIATTVTIVLGKIIILGVMISAPMIIFTYIADWHNRRTAIKQMQNREVTFTSFKDRIETK